MKQTARLRTPSPTACLAAWLGVHALLLQLLLPLFHHPVRFFDDPAAIARALSAMADAGMAHHATHHGDYDGTALADCPLCLAVQQPTPFVPPSVPVLAPPRRADTIVQTSSSVAAIHWQSHTARARGPPQRA